MDDSFPEIHKSEGILNVKGRNKTMNIKAEQKQKVTLPSPLFRDPIYDCPTDPTVIWNEKEEQWYLLYTQRRATDVPIGVSWVHGTALGVATSGWHKMAVPRNT